MSNLKKFTTRVLLLNRAKDDGKDLLKLDLKSFLADLSGESKNPKGTQVKAIGLDQMITSIADLDRQKKDQLSPQEQVRLAVIEVLGQLGELSVTDDSVLFQGEKFVIPTSYEGRVLEAALYLKKYH